MWRSLTRTLRNLTRAQAVEDDVSEEVRFHLEARAADLTARGIPEAEARRQARLEFGAVERYRDETRRAAGISWLADLTADVRYATRLARRQPAFAFAALASLALGIGVNTLVFSVASGLILRPLPVSHPEALAFIMNRGGPGLSYPAYRDLRDRSTTLSGLTGYRIAPMSVEHDRTASRAWGYLVTGDYFDVLGVHPAAGRFFHAEDDRPPAQSPVAVLSYAYWMSRFAGAPAVVGSTIRINGMPYTVFGVAPPGFFGTEIFYRPDIFVPMTMQPQIEARSSWLDARTVQNLFVVGRLRPQVGIGQAQADLTALSASLAHEHAATDEGMALRLTEPGLLGDTLRGPMKAFSFGILFLAMLVLLMACVNLAVMLTARGADRRRELAIRLSIGAGAGRIVRQLLTETLLSSLVGGAIGLALAMAASRVLSAWRPPVDVPIQFDVSPDLRVFVFALAVATIAGISFGLAPALQASRTDAQAALKGLDPRQGRRRRWAMRDILVVAQVAVCFVLVAGCLLALRGLQSALTMPIGFRPEGVTMIGYDVGLAGYTAERGAEFEGRVIEAVRQLPGVEHAAYADTIPLYLNQSNASVIPDDHPDLPVSERRQASRFEVSPDFFTTMGIRLLAGRPLEASDTSAASPVAVVNETFARAVLHTAAPVGRRFRDSGHSGWVEVVGLAEDGKYQALSEPPRPAMFEPIAQNYQATISLVVRSALPSSEVIASVRRAFAELDPSIPLYETQTLNGMLGVALLPSRAAAIALGAFGALAVLLALTGLHGIVSHAVAKRQKEIGIRLAIGARPSAILRLVLSRTLVLLATGVVVGLVLVRLGRQVLASIVYQASPSDPAVLAAVGACLALVGLLACWAPARRSVRVSPILALRQD
jgi:predicted permease